METEIEVGDIVEVSKGLSGMSDSIIRFWVPGGEDHPQIEEIFPTFGSLAGALVVVDGLGLNDVGRDPELCALHLFNRPEIYLVLDIDDLCPLSPLVRLAMEAEDECV